MRFMSNEQIMPILERFGLDRLASINTIQIDRDLISAIIERWRRETHTFHLPVGEMTVTLEDVSCLWGLPINGYRFEDDNWEEDVLQAFDCLKWASFRRPPGTYHMSTNWLCEPWVPARENENGISRPRARLPDNAGDQEVRYYACAYMMNLFSFVMFSNHSGYI
jgi:Plant mobile domain